MAIWGDQLLVTIQGDAIKDNLVMLLSRTCSIKDTTKIETNFYLNKIWIQCENNTCLKWRLLTKQDARQFDLNQPWYCHLSSDPCFNNCSVPEDHFPAESQFYRNGLKFIYSQLAMGSLVMVKLNRWPRLASGVTLWVAQVDDFMLSHYQFTALPFGLALAPRSFTKIMAGLAAFIHAQGISLTLDDMLPKDQIQTKWYKSALEEAKQIYAFTCEQRIEMCHLQAGD
ncbi:zinc finger CW-type PWWP domain protein 2 [Rhinophrynus dorsalis]